MKKYMVLSAVLLGVVASSQAGGLRIPLPPLPPLPLLLPGITFEHPAPRVVVRPDICIIPPAVGYVPPPPVVCLPPPVVYIRPPVVYARPYAYGSYGRGHDWDRRGGHGHNDRHDSHDRGNHR